MHVFNAIFLLALLTIGQALWLGPGLAAADATDLLPSEDALEPGADNVALLRSLKLRWQELLAAIGRWEAERAAYNARYAGVDESPDGLAERARLEGQRVLLEQQIRDFKGAAGGLRLKPGNAPGPAVAASRPDGAAAATARIKQALSALSASLDKPMPRRDRDQVLTFEEMGQEGRLKTNDGGLDSEKVKPGLTFDPTSEEAQAERGRLGWDTPGPMAGAGTVVAEPASPAAKLVIPAGLRDDPDVQMLRSYQSQAVQTQAVVAATQAKYDAARQAGVAGKDLEMLLFRCREAQDTNKAIVDMLTVQTATVTKKVVSFTALDGGAAPATDGGVAP